MEPRKVVSRGYSSWLLYGAFGSMAFLLNGLGAVLAPLQKDLHVNRGEVAFYPSLFAAASSSSASPEGPSLAVSAELQPCASRSQR